MIPRLLDTGPAYPITSPTRSTGPMATLRPGIAPTLVLVATLTACSPAATPPSATVVRDSAGVTIVESSAEEGFSAPWALGDDPLWRVGQVEGAAEYLLSRVEGAMRLPGGEVLVGNGDTNELRLYGEDGRLIRSLGGEGEGPGEFEYLRALGRCREDGFVAFDLNWQMNEYLWDGTFLEKSVLQAPDGITPYELACDAHGHMVILGWGIDRSAGPQFGFFQAWAPLVLSEGDGTIAVGFGRRLVSERIGNAGGSRPHPAGRATVFALYDDLLFVGSGERFEVEIWDLDGRLRTLLRGPRVSLEVTDSLVAAYLDAWLEVAPPERAPTIRREVAEWDWPESVPAFTDLSVDSEGVVWVRRYSPDASQPEVWSLLHPQRGYLGDLALGPDQQLLEAGGDYVLVLARDELDVEAVLMLPLQRGADADPQP